MLVRANLLVREIIRTIVIKILLYKINSGTSFYAYVFASIYPIKYVNLMVLTSPWFCNGCAQNMTQKRRRKATHKYLSTSLMFKKKIRKKPGQQHADTSRKVVVVVVKSLFLHMIEKYFSSLGNTISFIPLIHFCVVTIVTVEGMYLLLEFTLNATIMLVLVT